MGFHIKIGTRRSPLAQWQANWVAQKLHDHGVTSELVLIETKGDRILHVGIPEIGSKGVFTEDLERQLATANIDIAVHSAKDMPSELPPGFEIVAFTQREQAHDVVVSFKSKLSLEQPLTLGTSSTRRVALLRHYYPHIKTCKVRGNLQTRIGKAEKGEMDGLVLAYAGVHRMELGHLIKKRLPVTQFVPAVGQGSLAIEVSDKLSADKKALLKQYLDDTPTSTALRSERAFLKRLQGGCSIPAFAHATIDKRILYLQGGIVSLDGSQKIEFRMQSNVDEGVKLGDQLAQKVLLSGGDQILTKIKEELNK